ncbi:UNVERIFIED_ORG: hypothetical protein BDK47_13323 [Anoxybacillus amylolyticus]
MAIYYLSTTGNDGNPGVSPSQPIKTFNRLSQLMQAGDIAYIAPGTYPVSVHGKFSPINTTPITDAGQMQIIGDTTGQIFGVSAGDVVIDCTGNYNIVNISNVWTGRLVLKGLKFTNLSITAQSQQGGILFVPSSNPNAVQIYFDSCVFPSLQNSASANIDGLLGYFYFSNSNSQFVIKGCTIGLGTTTAYNTPLFTLSSGITNNVDTGTSATNHHVKIINTTIYQEEGATLPGYYHRIFNIGYNYYGASYVSSIGQLRILLKGVTIRPKSTDIYFKGSFTEFAYGAIAFDIEDSNINIYNINSWVRNNTSLAMVINVRRSVLKANSYGFLAFTSLNIQFSKIVVGSGSFSCNNTAISVTVEKSFFVNQSGASPDINTAGSYGTFVALDTVFSGFRHFDCGNPSKNATFKRCLFVNCGGVQGTGAADYLFYSTHFTTIITDCIALKLPSGYTLMYVAGTSTDNTLLHNIITNNNNITGTSGYIISQLNVQTISSNLQERTNLPLPDVVVPEMDNPITGTKSALIPVACIGRGRFRVLLEGGRSNSINLTIQKSWTGGKVEFWIENTKLNATVNDNTAAQNITLTYTPPKTGIYELEIFGYDGVSQTTFTNSYQPNYIKVDAVSVV